MLLKLSEVTKIFLMSPWCVRMVNRIILASCSPLFMGIFRNTKHSHPLIYMRGLWSVDLEAILDFAYCQSLCKLRTGQLTRELRTANCLLFLLYVCDLSDICLIILILSILCYFFLIIFFGCLRICVLTYDTHFWGAPRIFQINYFANMSDKVERLEI